MQYLYDSVEYALKVWVSFRDSLQKAKKMRKKMKLRNSRAPKYHIFFWKKTIFLNETLREETKKR